MAMTREDMLRELELLPAWKLREPISMKPAVATKVEIAKEEDYSTASVLEMPTKLEVSESVLSQIQVIVTPVHESTQSVLAEAAFKPVEVEEKIELLEERANAIKHMDWQALQACVKDCQACTLAASRSQTVFGMGDANADWLIIGEAPGKEEDIQGEPFLDQAGKLLDNMLAAIQLKRSENVYISNVLKCRTPENRDPQEEEVRECAHFLKRQIELIKPKLILALGESAALFLLQSENTIASMRGQLHQYHNVPVIVTYHPAYLLRNLSDKAKAWEDLCFARKTMQSL